MQQEKDAQDLRECEAMIRRHSSDPDVFEALRNPASRFEVLRIGMRLRDYAAKLAAQKESK